MYIATILIHLLALFFFWETYSQEFVTTGIKPLSIWMLVLTSSLCLEVIMIRLERVFSNVLEEDAPIYVYNPEVLALYLVYTSVFLSLVHSGFFAYIVPATSSMAMKIAYAALLGLCATIYHLFLGLYLLLKHIRRIWDPYYPWSVGFDQTVKAGSLLLLAAGIHFYGYFLCPDRLLGSIPLVGLKLILVLVFLLDYLVVCLHIPREFPRARMWILCGFPFCFLVAVLVIFYGPSITTQFVASKAPLSGGPSAAYALRLYAANRLQKLYEFIWRVEHRVRPDGARLRTRPPPPPP